MDLIREWWSAIMFVIGGVSAFIVQRERTRWQLSTLGDELAGIKETLKELRVGQAEQALLGAELRTEISNLKHRLDRGGK
ncbi:MAG: hypothetical protein QM523_01100 [Candidatus Pacebacteria bacterium]|nr:hypothetical protein [Candidatus Paceibacterota bacterium]